MLKKTITSNEAQTGGQEKKGLKASLSKLRLQQTRNHQGQKAHTPQCKPGTSPTFCLAYILSSVNFIIHMSIKPSFDYALMCSRLWQLHVWKCGCNVCTNGWVQTPRRQSRSQGWLGAPGYSKQNWCAMAAMPATPVKRCCWVSLCDHLHK